MAEDAEKGGHPAIHHLSPLPASGEKGPGPSYKELAEQFDTTETAVTNHLHRARGRFRTYLLRVIRDTVGDPDGFS